MLIILTSSSSGGDGGEGRGGERIKLFFAEMEKSHLFTNTVLIFTNVSCLDRALSSLSSD